ncbi:MAG: hypothetical protein IBX57_00520 [Gammaproteobacteria bacterium]|nr:hypothetical protein [Gammaproteobacteria bacterium]
MDVEKEVKVKPISTMEMMEEDVDLVWQIVEKVNEVLGISVRSKTMAK